MWLIDATGRQQRFRDVVLRNVRHADRTLVMDQEQLVGQGRHEHLVAQAWTYARLWMQQEHARRRRLGG